MDRVGTIIALGSLATLLYMALMVKGSVRGSKPTENIHAHRITSAISNIDGDEQVESSRVHIALLSNRDFGSSVVVDSTCKNTKNAAYLTFHVISDTIREFQSNFDKLESCKGARLEIQTIDNVMEELLQLGYELKWTSNEVDGQWGLTTPFSDIKHSDPLNLVRFYLPHLKSFADVDRIIFLDDDIIVQKDITMLKNWDLAANKAMVVGCQHWQWSPTTPGDFSSTTHVNMRDIGYLGNFDTTCVDEEDEGPCVRPGLQDELVNLAEEINGHKHGFAHNPLESQAFNMGLNAIDTSMWKALQLTERFEKWVDASFQERLYAPDTLAFGLGLAYLALGDVVECYDTELVHLVGLAFVSMESFKAHDWTTERMKDDAFALHYNGANKPWELPMPSCNEVDALSRRPELPHHIWQQACLDSGLCSCQSTNASAPDKPTTPRLRGERHLHEGEYVGRHLEGEYVNRHLDEEYVGRRLDGEYVNRRLDGEYVNRRLDGEYVNRRLDGEYVNRRLDGEYVNRRLDGEYVNRRLDGEYVNRRLDGEYVNRRLDGEYVNRRLDGEYVNRRLDGEYVNRRLATKES